MEESRSPGRTTIYTASNRSCQESLRVRSEVVMPWNVNVRRTLQTSASRVKSIERVRAPNGMGSHRRVGTKSSRVVRLHTTIDVVILKNRSRSYV